MAAQKSDQKLRLWVLPWGLYPRRVTIYLAEKGLQDRFEIIPVEISPSGMEEVEGKPHGTLPILELSRPTADKPGQYIFQSSAILEYLEDVYGAEGSDMRGSTPQARARTRECMDVMNEVTTWMALYMQNASTLYSHLMEQNEASAREGLKRIDQALTLLEKLSDEQAPFLLGQSPAIVDCVLMSSAQFAYNVYNFDLVADHPRLKRVIDAFKKRGTANFPALPEWLQALGNEMTVK